MCWKISSAFYVYVYDKRIAYCHVPSYIKASDVCEYCDVNALFIVKRRPLLVCATTRAVCYKMFQMSKREYRNYNIDALLLGISQKNMFIGQKVTGIPRQVLCRYKTTGQTTFMRIGRKPLLSEKTHADLIKYMR